MPTPTQLMPQGEDDADHLVRYVEGDVLGTARLGSQDLVVAVGLLDLAYSVTNRAGAQTEIALLARAIFLQRQLDRSLLGDTLLTKPMKVC